jgi:hypothetical protein
MQAAAARVGTSRLQPVLRGLAFAAGLAARAATRAVEHFARYQALAYVTGEITLADILLYLTATFEDVDVPPEPEPVPVPVPVPGPDIDERVVTAVFGGMVVIAGAFFVGMRSHKKQKRRCHPYALMGQWYGTSSSHEEAPAPATATAQAAPPPRRAIEPFPPLPRRAVAPFDASRAVVAWHQECEAAGIKHRMHQRK